jgi:hypothetical protein
MSTVAPPPLSTPETYRTTWSPDPARLPEIPELTAITLAEPHQGVATAKDAATRARRTEKLGAAIVYTRNAKDFAGFVDLVEVVEV